MNLRAAAIAEAATPYKKKRRLPAAPPSKRSSKARAESLKDRIDLLKSKLTWILAEADAENEAMTVTDDANGPIVTVGGLLFRDYAHYVEDWGLQVWRACPSCTIGDWVIVDHARGKPTTLRDVGRALLSGSECLSCGLLWGRIAPPRLRGGERG